MITGHCHMTREYLPVEDFTKAVLDTGFKGYISVEVFDGKAKEKYGEDMKPYAKKAMGSLERLINECQERKGKRTQR
jgi:sugar phosphate isomerase/epimerase